MKKWLTRQREGHVLFLLVLLLSLSTNSIAQQARTLTGRVTDDDGTALSGVSIVASKSNSATTTNSNGDYTITVQGDDALTFSMVGFAPQTVFVKNRSNISLQLTNDSKEMEQVVVVGYGTQKKSDLTGSVSSVNTKELNKSLSVSADQALQGRAAGVNVVANTGQPGTVATVNIRGIGTVNNSNPLYIIDGVPRDNILNLNMADIESMDILKDASASAIYGSRAANGVILITTKKGKAGKVEVNYNGYVGTQSAWRMLDVLNATQWAELRNEARQNDGLPALPELANPASLPSTDWTRLAYQNGMMHNHQLSVSSGTDKVKYFLSISDVSQEGIIKSTEFDRLTVRLNNSYKLFDNLEVGHNLSYSKGKRAQNTEYGNQITNRLAFQGFVMDPVTSVYDANGALQGSKYSSSWNPIGNVLYEGTSTTLKDFLGNAYLKFDFLKDFQFYSNFGITSENREANNFRPSYYISGPQQNPTNSYNSMRSAENTTVWTNTLSYKRTILNDHQFNVMIGQESQQTKFNILSGVRSAIPLSIGNPTLSSGNSSTASNDGTFSESALLSYFGRVNYNYDNRYLVTLNYRRDGSSRFGSANRWGTFPSFALGWNISNEDFFQSNLINQLKLRGGYGEIGSQSFADYAYFSIISTGQNVTFGQPENINFGAAPNSAGNPDLKWETTKGSNIGVDVGLWNNKLTFTADVFKKNTTDMLLRLPVLSIVGLSAAPYQNAGNIENKGLEMAANYNGNVQKLKFSLGGNIAFIRNKVLSLGTQGNVLESGYFFAYPGVSRTEVGQPVGSFYAYKMDGLFQTQDEVNRSSQPNARPGDVRYVDINEDGKIDAKDRTFIGSPLPDFTYGFNLNASYGNFDLTAFIQGSQGNEIYSSVPWYLMGNVSWNQSVKMLDRWTGPGTSNTIPRATEIYNTQNVMPSSRYIYDGSYLRLKNLQLGYNFSSDLTRKVHIDRLRVYVTAQNLLTFTKYDDGMDPEIGVDPTFNDPLNIGIDRGVYPQARSFTFGLNVTL